MIAEIGIHEECGDPSMPDLSTTSNPMQSQINDICDYLLANSLSFELFYYSLFVWTWKVIFRNYYILQCCYLKSIF